MKNFILCLLSWGFACSSTLIAQSNSSQRTDNWVYDAHIYTPQLYAAEDPTTFPVLFLGENGYLTLEFDELMSFGSRQSDFMIDFVHCDVDWQPSNLLSIEYWSGFQQTRISQYFQSGFPRVPYMHYLHTFPEEGNSFKKSGNYLLRVLRDGDESQPVLSLRFVVAERQTNASMVGVIRNSNRLPISEMRFQVDASALPGIDPLQQMQLCLLQNFRWDNAKYDLSPMLWNGSSYQYRVAPMQDFSSWQEFRRVNLRSTRMNLENIRGYQPTDSSFVAYLYHDAPIAQSQTTAIRDYNGSYIIRTDDHEYADTDADYILAKFAFNMTEQKGKDVYLIGGFSLWQPDSRFKMTFSPAENTYRAEVLLKQGTYDYSYGIYPASAPARFSEPWNGTAAECENFYTLLVYYKGIGDRAYRVVGCHALNYQE